MSRIPKVRSASGIVWLASYPRSGNTWARNFIYNLLNILEGAEATDINRLQTFSLWDIAAVRFEKVLGKPITSVSRAEIAKARPLVQKDVAKQAQGPVLVKTHNALVLDHGVPTISMAVTAGAVYIVRNPLDVAVSFAHHFGIDIDRAITRMNRKGLETDVNAHTAYEVYGSWSQNVMSWTHKPHDAILVLRYEDMLSRPMETFRSLADHLVIQASDEQIAQAMELSSFERAKEQERQRGYRERPQQSKAFFREGRAEQWRDALSPDQIGRLVTEHREQMARFDYAPDGY